MHIHKLDTWKHSHQFTLNAVENEKKTLRVVILTGMMMVIEIIAGWTFGSIALLADGWHMGTHAAALGITLFAYWYAKHHANNPRYTFGTGKMSILGGFTSAVVLLVVALLMMIESLERFWNPETIQFTEAIFVAIVGLVVNLVSVYLLADHQYAHDHNHDHHHGHSDHNIRAAYLHVMADALTSVLAIFALLAGRAFGWIWMDALMGIIGGIVITRWALRLLRETSLILLDGGVDEKVTKRICSLIENDADNRVTDVHVWRINTTDLAAVISLVTHYPRPVDHYQELLSGLEELKHTTIEIYVCREKPCLPVSIPAI
jgi:cation diffusion facilitator family transporter